MSFTDTITTILGFILGTVPGFLVSTTIFLLVIWYKSRPKNLPPGPLGVPLLGFLPFIKICTMPQQMVELSKKYGPIVSMFFGSKLVLILNGYETNRKALVEHGDVFSGRPKNMTKHIDRFEELHLALSDGLHWREHRRFALSKLRDYGIGRASIEPAIINEVEYFLEEVKKMNNKDLNFRQLLSLSICNNVLILELGKRLEYTDPHFIKLKDALEELIELNGMIVEQHFPWVEKIPIINRFFQFKEMRASHEMFHDYMRHQIKEHRKEYVDRSDNDYINAYFTEKNNRVKNNNYPELFDDDTLVANLKVMFLAGMETSTTTLLWAILHLILHPDVQRKVQKEIDDVIGNERSPSFTDRLRMPYTEAVLLEVQRIGLILPFSLPHRVTQDIIIEGHTLPKDAIVFPNLWSIHFDEKLYPDPHSFRPERFINEEGKVVKPDWLVSFSMGKRFCLGEPLARIELFLYLTAIFQRFTLAHPKSGATLSANGHFNGALHGPLPFEAHVSLRSN